MVGRHENKLLNKEVRKWFGSAHLHLTSRGSDSVRPAATMVRADPYKWTRASYFYFAISLSFTTIIDIKNELIKFLLKFLIKSSSSCIDGDVMLLLHKMRLRASRRLCSHQLARLCSLSHGWSTLRGVGRGGVRKSHGSLLFLKGAHEFRCHWTWHVSVSRKNLGYSSWRRIRKSRCGSVAMI